MKGTTETKALIIGLLGKALLHSDYSELRPKILLDFAALFNHHIICDTSCFPLKGPGLRGERADVRSRASCRDKMARKLTKPRRVISKGPWDNLNKLPLCKNETIGSSKGVTTEMVENINMFKFISL